MNLPFISKKRRTIEEEFTFMDHLEALRWHLLRSAFVILAFACVAFSYKEFLFDVLILGPKNPDFFTYKFMCHLGQKYNLGDLCVKEIKFNIINTELSGQFSKHFSVSIVSAFIAATPYVLWEIWRFIKPALHTKEQSYASGFVLVASMLFFIGVLFGYFVIVPMSINFLGSYEVSAQILNQITLDSYIGTITTLTLCAGLIFELPMIIYFLSKIGLVTAKFLSDYRRYAVLIILVAAAIITPTPDIPTQLLVSGPLYLLFEVSILVARRVEANKAKAIIID